MTVLEIRTDIFIKNMNEKLAEIFTPLHRYMYKDHEAVKMCIDMYSKPEVLT